MLIPSRSQASGLRLLQPFCLALTWLLTTGQALASDPEAAPEIRTPEEAPAADAAMQNARMKTLEGSKSPWSGQFQMSYSGSSIDHPFSELAPNPTHEPQEPLVTLSGVVAVRYRLDPKTTVGLGSGIVTETPFQGPKHSTLSDPQVDIARSFTLGPLHNRVDATLVQYTNHQYYNEYGYRQELSLALESFHEFSSGLTIGLQLATEGNTFATGGDYPKAQQVDYMLAVAPYFEYTLNSTFNLRSVIGIVDNHLRDKPDPKVYQHPNVYQTFGLGISVTKAVFVYCYAKAQPYSGEAMTVKNTTAGFSTIINLF